MEQVGLDLIKATFHGDEKNAHVFVVLGASGDLARKKIYPTLWWLYRDKLLPHKTHFIGYARSDISVQSIREKATEHMKVCPKWKRLVTRAFTTAPLFVFFTF